MTLLPGEYMTFNPAGAPLTVAVERVVAAFAARFRHNPSFVYVPGPIPDEQVTMWHVHGVAVREYSDALGLVRAGPVA